MRSPLLLACVFLVFASARTTRSAAPLLMAAAAKATGRVAAGELYDAACCSALAGQATLAFFVAILKSVMVGGRQRWTSV
jgi:hypothetical protein